MDRQDFITRPLSQLLDVVRAMAALVVLAGHAVGFHLYDGVYPIDRSGPHNAVMVFFVLSGLVITHSVQTRSTSAAEYAAARLARILPLTVVAVGFSLMVALYGTMLGIEYSEPGPSLANVLLPLLFLSESAFGSGLVWNTPFWSLAYEAMYYALFGVAVFTTGRTRWVLLIIMVLLAGLKVVLLLPVWLMGVVLARGKDRWAVGSSAGLGLIVLGCSVIAVATRYSSDGTAMLASSLGQTADQLGFSDRALTDYAIGLGVMACFIGMRPLAGLVEPQLDRWRRPIRIAADLSFPVYILHLPMLILLSAYGVNAGGNPIAFAGILGAMILTCAAISAPVDRRCAGLRAALAVRFAGKRASTPLPA